MEPSQIDDLVLCWIFFAPKDIKMVTSFKTKGDTDIDQREQH